MVDEIVSRKIEGHTVISFSLYYKHSGRRIWGLLRSINPGHVCAARERMINDKRFADRSLLAEKQQPSI